MRDRVVAGLRGPRFWTLFSMLCARGVGFVTSFAVARLAGAHWLGAYSAVLNTASAVTAPVAQVLANNATLTAAHAYREGRESFRKHAKGHILLGLALSLPACLLFAWLQRSAAGDTPSAVWNVMLVSGCCVASGQVLAGVIQGFYQGAGRFLAAAWMTAAVAAVMGILAIPAVWFGGVSAALLIASVVALGPALLLGIGIFRARGWKNDIGVPLNLGNGRAPLHEAAWRLWRAVPSVGAMAVNATVNWVCTIYLVRNGYGLAGVGVVAVAIQWSTLLLMPATSWGGLTLKALTDGVAGGSREHVREVVRRQIVKNVITTAVMGAALCLASGLIARAYGLGNTDLWLLLCINAASAIVASANNVFERLLVCLDAQPRWFVQSVVALGVQVAFTASLVHISLAMVAVGVLLAGITQAVFCVLSLHRLLVRIGVRGA